LVPAEAELKLRPVVVQPVVVVVVGLERYH
jgi:hypothetical protein